MLKAIWTPYDRRMQMRRFQIAGVALVALFIAAAGPKGFDKIRVKGTLPSVVTEAESEKDLSDRILGQIVAHDHMMAKACGTERLYEFLPVAARVVADPLAQRYAEGEREFFVIRVRATGCGNARVHNLYAFKRSGPLHLIVTTPGTSLVTSLELQLNLQRALYDTVLVKDKCPDEAFVTDTYVLDLPTPQQEWTEVWSTLTCGAPARFKISFKEDSTGVSYSILPMV